MNNPQASFPAMAAGRAVDSPVSAQSVSSQAFGVSSSQSSLYASPTPARLSHMAQSTVVQSSAMILGTQTTEASKSLDINARSLDILDSLLQQATPTTQPTTGLSFSPAPSVGPNRPAGVATLHMTKVMPSHMGPQQLRSGLLPSTDLSMGSSTAPPLSHPTRLPSASITGPALSHTPSQSFSTHNASFGSSVSLLLAPTSAGTGVGSSLPVRMQGQAAYPHHVLGVGPGQASSDTSRSVLSTSSAIPRAAGGLLQLEPSSVTPRAPASPGALGRDRSTILIPGMGVVQGNFEHHDNSLYFVSVDRKIKYCINSELALSLVPNQLSAMSPQASNVSTQPISMPSATSLPLPLTSTNACPSGPDRSVTATSSRQSVPLATVAGWQRSGPVANPAVVVLTTPVVPDTCVHGASLTQQQPELMSCPSPTSEPMHQVPLLQSSYPDPAPKPSSPPEVIMKEEDSSDEDDLRPLSRLQEDLESRPLSVIQKGIQETTSMPTTKVIPLGPVATPRKRGRPRKQPLTTDMTPPSVSTAHQLAPPVPKRKKEAGNPVKPPSAYRLFSKEKYPSLKAVNKELTVSQITKLISQLWDGMPNEERKPYMDLHRKMMDQFVASVELQRLKVASPVYRQNSSISPDTPSVAGSPRTVSLPGSPATVAEYQVEDTAAAAPEPLGCAHSPDERSKSSVLVPEVATTQIVEPVQELLPARGRSPKNFVVPPLKVASEGLVVTLRLPRTSAIESVVSKKARQSSRLAKESMNESSAEISTTKKRSLRNQISAEPTSAPKKQSLAVVPGKLETTLKSKNNIVAREVNTGILDSSSSSDSSVSGEERDLETVVPPVRRRASSRLSHPEEGKPGKAALTGSVALQETAPSMAPAEASYSNPPLSSSSISLTSPSGVKPAPYRIPRKQMAPTELPKPPELSPVKKTRQCLSAGCENEVKLQDKDRLGGFYCSAACVLKYVSDVFQTFVANRSVSLATTPVMGRTSLSPT